MQTAHALPPAQPSIFHQLSAEEILSQMSLEEKAGQLFIGFFWGKTLSDDTQQFLHRSKLGNVIYFAWSNGLENPEQIATLSKEVQDTIVKATKIPPIISTDQEGGIVQRLQNGFTRFPGNMALGATNDPMLAYETGKVLAKELTSVGINFNLAPVVDVQIHNLHPWYMGIRTYGTNPSHVIHFTKEQIRGMTEKGLLYVLKHAPGLGGVAVNPHLALPTCDKSLEQLESCEFAPFRHFLDAPAMMTAHVIFSALDPKTPASLSYEVTTNLIRKTWGYEGVIMTDSLSMNAVLQDTSTFERAVESVKQAAIKAIQAGADCIILGRLEWAAFSPTEKQDEEVIEKAIQGIVENVQSGVLSEERINDSVLRLIKMKQKISQNTSISSFTPNDKLSAEIAQKSLTLLSSPSLLSAIGTGFKAKKICVIAPKDIENTMREMLKERAITADTLFFEQTSLQDPSVREKIKASAAQSELTLFFSYNATNFSLQKTLMKELARETSPQRLLFVGLRNPYDLLGEELHLTHNTFLTYSPTKYSLESVFKALEEKTIPSGKIPFSITE